MKIELMSPTERKIFLIVMFEQMIDSGLYDEHYKYLTDLLHRYMGEQIG